MAQDTPPGTDAILIRATTEVFVIRKHGRHTAISATVRWDTGSYGYLNGMSYVLPDKNGENHAFYSHLVPVMGLTEGETNENIFLIC